MGEESKHTVNLVIGYLLLFLGVAAILMSALNALSLLSGRTQPRKLFSFEGISLDLGATLPESVQRVQLPKANPQELISKDMINDPINLTTHLFFLWFFIGVGHKLAQIGIQLVTPARVKEQP